MATLQQAVAILQISDYANRVSVVGDSVLIKLTDLPSRSRHSCWV